MTISIYLYGQEHAYNTILKINVKQMRSFVVCCDFLGVAVFGVRFIPPVFVCVCVLYA